VYVVQLKIKRVVSVFTIDGKLLARWGSQQNEDMETALFIGPHAEAVDSRGDIYVGEIRGEMAKVDQGSRAVQKFAKKT
jgi:hypothetical protein